MLPRCTEITEFFLFLLYLMDSHLYAFATPLSLGLSALVATCVYRSYPCHHHLRWFTAFLCLLALGLTSQLLMTAPQRHQFVLFTTSSYLMATVCLAQALSVRLCIPVHWLGVVLTCALTLAGMWFFANHSPDMSARLVVLSVGTAAIKLQTLWQMRHARICHRFDQLSIALYALMAVTLLLRPFLLLLDHQGMDAVWVSSHLSWGFTSLAAMVLCNLLALSMSICTLMDSNLQLRNERNHDDLTGLLTRRAFEERCGLYPYTQGLRVLVFADIDHFKCINDQHGHAAGDAVLTHLGQVLRSNLRTDDVVGRIGGEEFAMALHDLDLNQAQQLLNRLAARLQESKRVHDSLPQTLRVTASFGLVLLRPAETLHSAMQRADRLLYQAKAAGRNCIYSESLA